MEELWKNWRNILWALERQRSGEELWKNRLARQIFLQFFHNSFPLAVYPSKDQNFHEDFVEKL
jgi:hypothetical protein